MKKIFLSLLILLFFPWNALAHSGGTNTEGCHTNRKTGEYHCHNKRKAIKQNKTTDAFSESSNKASTSGEAGSHIHNTRRIFQWVDEQGKVHYSNDINDLPDDAQKSQKSK